MKLTLCIAAALLMVGCATAPPELQQLQQTFVVDLNAAKANFDMAQMAVEAQCVQTVIDAVGADQAKQFQIAGIVSAGSVAYIKYAQLRGGAASKISDSCYAVIGKIGVAATKEGASAFSGGLVR